MIAVESMLTTEDNPFSPFTQFKEWYAWDLSHGHDTLAYLARVANTSTELSESDQLLINEQAIDEIISEDPFNIYRKVSQPIEINV